MSASRADTLRLERMSGAGNRFVVLDLFGVASPDSPDSTGAAALAREACPAHDVDGFLVLERPTCGGDARMVVHNADGSRPEACGNGLRCIAALAVARGYVAADVLRVETDAGLRAVRVHRAREIVAATAEMGVPECGEPETLLVLGTEIAGVRVGMGNPHFAVFVDDVACLERTPVAELGAALETHAAFPEHTNVEFCALAGTELRMRVWERGVGETLSCGSGACAAAVVAIRAGHTTSPVTVITRGGELTAEWPGSGPIRLTGPVEFGGPV